MSTFVYVGNLSTSTTEDMVRQAFAASQHPARSVALMRSPQNDRSRGFAFVELGTEEEAMAAIQALNGVELEGKPMRVSTARERIPERGFRTSFQSYSGLGGRTSGGARRPGGAKRKHR